MAVALMVIAIYVCFLQYVLRFFCKFRKKDLHIRYIILTFAVSTQKFYDMVIQQGTKAPKPVEVKRTEEVVRKIVVKKPGSEEVYHVGLQAEEKDGTLKINLGDND
jgi:hypothetical protein